MKRQNLAPTRGGLGGPISSSNPITGNANVPTHNDVRHDARASRSRPASAHTPVRGKQPTAAAVAHKRPAADTPLALVRKRRRAADSISARHRWKSLTHALADSPEHSQSPLRPRHRSKSCPQWPTLGRLRSRSEGLPRPLPGRLLRSSFFSYLAFRCSKVVCETGRFSLYSVSRYQYGFST